jgi:hypothetical protein
VCWSDLRYQVGIRVEAQINPHETSVYRTAAYGPAALFFVIYGMRIAMSVSGLVD